MTISITDHVKSKDMSHHLNAVARARRPSPLKDIVQYMARDGMISFAGGLPHQSLFPFKSLNFTALQDEAFFGTPDPETLVSTLDKYAVASETALPNSVSLAQALQYSGGDGQKPLAQWAQKFVQTVYQPGYLDFEVLLNNGNTDGWCKVIRTLCEPNDYILCEDHTYPSAQALWAPMGCKAAPVKMDGSGMRADDLETVLSTWDVKFPGVRRPHLLYIVPSGSNPSSSSMPARRRREIYDVCVRYDVIICEDEPYYFLQYKAYEPSSRKTSTNSNPEEFLSSLAPTFLHLDREGRVIRLESFSKTLAPGLRLGYFVTNPVFIEKLLRATEVETQAPSGWSQLIVFELLKRWDISGYVRWLSNLSLQYQTRRDWMCDAFCKSFRMEDVDNQLYGYLKTDSSLAKPVFSFVAPTAGMFIWVKFYFSNSPLFQSFKSDALCNDAEQAFERHVWACMIDQDVLLTPGSYYFPWQGADKTTTITAGREEGIGFFRLAFSTSTKDEIVKGMERLAMVIDKVWQN